jgi:hypothetical protein
LKTPFQQALSVFRVAQGVLNYCVCGASAIQYYLVGESALIDLPVPLKRLTKRIALRKIFSTQTAASYHELSIMKGDAEIS